MEFSIKFDTVLYPDGPLCILRGHRLKFPKNTIFVSLKVDFVLASSVDPDEMPHYASGTSLFAKVPVHKG